MLITSQGYRLHSTGVVCTCVGFVRGCVCSQLSTPTGRMGGEWMYAVYVFMIFHFDLRVCVPVYVCYFPFSLCVHCVWWACVYVLAYVIEHKSASAFDIFYTNLHEII